MENFEILNEKELKVTVGGGNRKVAKCAGYILKSAGSGVVMGGIRGTAAGVGVGTFGGALFGGSIGVIEGSASCVGYLVSHRRKR